MSNKLNCSVPTRYVAAAFAVPTTGLYGLRNTVLKATNGAVGCSNGVRANPCIIANPRIVWIHVNVNFSESVGLNSASALLFVFGIELQV